MRTRVLEHLSTRFRNFENLVESLESSTLTQHLEVPKNKSVGEHFWCLIGARESYTRALKAGGWEGFSCSLKRIDKAPLILEHLQASSAAFQQTVDTIEDWTAAQENLLLDLLEHETMHEGQLIRQLYGLERAPTALKWA